MRWLERLLERIGDWIDGGLAPPDPPIEACRLKFPKGMQWTCVKCGTVLGITKRDIWSGEIASSSAWDIKDEGFWSFRHCGADAGRRNGGVTEFHTPDGWVG